MISNADYFQGKQDAASEYLPRIEKLTAALEQATAEVGRLEKLVYLAGHWSCPKCDFYLVSTNLHVPSGGFSANQEPQACANGCGPMWRVTHEQSANTMVNRCEKQTDRIEQLEAALHPGKQSCDCCIRQQYKGETFWMIECQCGNHDDIGRAQAWCSMANSYEGATGKSVIAGISLPVAEWSLLPPTQSGWYWYRHAPSSHPEIFQARNTKDGIAIYFDEWRSPSWFEGEWWSARIASPQSDGDKSDD